MIKYFYINNNFFSFFGFGKRKVKKAVDDVSFSIKEGHVSVLVGESGSGKTTLARIILRAINPDSGKIFFEGEEITEKKGKDLKKFRRNVQIIHQDPYSSLNPRMKVLDIVKEPIDIFFKNSPRDERKKMVIDALNDVLLLPSEEIAEKYPHMLSGGERQRVAMARALVIKPRLIVADEPVSMLDVSTRAEILQLIRKLTSQHKITCLYITHDLATSHYVGDEISVMYSGKIVERGNIENVLSNPLHPYTQALLDAVTEPDYRNLEKERTLRIKNDKVPIMDKGCNFYNRCLYRMDICKNEPSLKEKNGQYVSCFLHNE